MTESGSAGDPGAPAGGGWSAPSAPPPKPVPGAAGLVYADVPNRAIAYIIDAIVIAIVNVVIFGVLGGIGLSIVSGNLQTGFSYNYVASVILGIIGLVISAVYFIYTWTSMRATVGMRILGMQIGNAVDGKTLTRDQAIRRWAIIAAPSVVAQALQPLPAIGALMGLLAFIWFCYLLYTTYKSPTKQGYHDIFANTMVVKAASSAL